MYLQRIKSSKQNNKFANYINTINNNINEANKILFLFFNIKHDQTQLFPGISNTVFIKTLNYNILETQEYLDLYPYYIDNNLLDDLLYRIQNVIQNANTSLLQVYTQNEINFLINY